VVAVSLGFAEVLEHLQQRPGGSSVGNSPLHHFAAPQSDPEVLAPLLGWLGHVRAPSGYECSDNARQRGSWQPNARVSQPFRRARQRNVACRRYVCVEASQLKARRTAPAGKRTVRDGENRPRADAGCKQKPRRGAGACLLHRPWTGTTELGYCRR